MSWLDPRQWLLVIAFCAASTLGYSFWSARLIAKGDAAGYARADQKHQTAAAAARQVAADQTAALQTAADTARKAHHAALHDLDRVRAELLDSLRNRPQRPASGAHLPTPASPGGATSGCTGAQLYRADGEFLAGESARAEAVRVSLLACYAQYRRAESLINGVQK